MRNICPSSPGGKDWQPSAYSPRTKLLYVPHNNLCEDVEANAVSYIAGPVAGLGWHVVSTDSRLAEHAGEEASPTVAELAVMLLAGCDLGSVAASADWAFLLTAARQQRPKLRLVRA